MKSSSRLAAAIHFAIVALAAYALGGWPARAEILDYPLNVAARDIKADLVNRIMPYWYDTAQDKVHGGYLLADDARGRGEATEKQIVTQARMVWGFAHAHRKGLKDGQRDYLGAARQGYEFIQSHFLDRVNGGYFWTTDLEGNPRERTKILYGESFVIYALVEYSRASGNKEPLKQALNLYHVIQKRAHDARNRGWVEHFEEDWRPMPAGDVRGIVEVAGLKSANTHLHLMEALTELYAETHSREVRKSLEEALRINSEIFYPEDPAKSCFHREPDWTPVPNDPFPGLSYGHNVEFAWLMIRAEDALGWPRDWKHFDAICEHALRYGYDHHLGGLYSKGLDDQPAHDTDKVWWVQAELLAALSDGLEHHRNLDYSEALKQLIEFIHSHQADPRDGIWYDTVTADGKIKSGGKAHAWKSNYHDVRGMVKFLDAYLPAK